MIGCYFVMFTIAAYGLSLATIQQPMLDSMGGGSYFSLITLIAAICMTIMTPIGGRLIDGLGNRTVTLYAGAISLISGLVMAFVPNLWVFIIMRILFSMAQGAMSSVPYILAREVNPPAGARQDLRYAGNGTGRWQFCRILAGGCARSEQPHVARRCIPLPDTGTRHLADL